MRPVRDRRRGGFTLIEVLVALVLMSVGVTMLLTALARSAENAAFARDNGKAVRIAQWEMSRLRHAEEMKPVSEEKEDGRFSWRTEIAEVTDERLQLKESERGGTRLELFRLEVLVRWRDAEGGPLRHGVHLASYRVRSTVERKQNPFESN